MITDKTSNLEGSEMEKILTTNLEMNTDPLEPEKVFITEFVEQPKVEKADQRMNTDPK